MFESMIYCSQIFNIW